MDILDLIGENSQMLLEEYNKIAADLALLGLSDYESRAYIALVAHGVSDAETIASTAQIPRTSAYKVLETLEDKGFVVAGKGRPKFYNPIPPETIRDRVFSKLDETFDKLASIREILKEHGMPQLVFTITGQSRVLDKIGEMMDTATETIIMATPNVAVMRPRVEKNLKAAAKRGVNITFIVPHGQKVPKGVKSIRRKGLIATDLIVDSTKALLASPELEVCGFTDNATLAAHLEGFLNIMMAHES